jgi:threonine/homoserine/homoserine lactone efflux protein
VSLSFLVRGIVIGFSIAAPVGPIGVLCIRRTLADGRAAGLATGLGAATADAIYGCMVAFGLTALTDWLVAGQTPIRLIGGAFLLYLGIRTIRAKPAERAARMRGSGLLGAYVTSFMLTITNPMTILSFVAIFTTIGIGTSRSEPLAAGSLVLGVFLGSALWWLTLSSAVGMLRSRFDLTRLGWVNRISGGLITAFGLAALLSLIRA